MYILTALLSALLFGIWLFGTGQWRGKVAVFSVILVSASSAAVVYVLVGLLSHDLVFDPRDASHGVLGGIVNVTGTVLVLKAYERGKMGVVAGVASASVIVALAFSFLGVSRCRPLRLLGSASSSPASWCSTSPAGAPSRTRQPRHFPSSWCLSSPDPLAG